MIYITCPTCGFFMGSKTIEFETKRNEICANTSLSEEEQAIEIQKLIKGLGLKRYCCRMRMMTGKDIVHDLVPVDNS